MAAAFSGEGCVVYGARNALEPHQNRFKRIRYVWGLSFPLFEAFFHRCQELIGGRAIGNPVIEGE
jgi:hypothetical protein